MTGSGAYILLKGETDAINQRIDNLPKAFIPQGSCKFSELPATPSKDKLGYIWNVTDAFTTDNRFIEGSGKKIAAGNNVGIIMHNDAYYYDVMSQIDLSNYYTKTEVDSLITAEKLARETADAGKLDIMPGDEHTAGNAYNLPYFFKTSADATKATVTAETVSLDGNKTYGSYSMDVNSATEETAGLMSAADKVKLNKAITEHQDISGKLNVLPKVDDPTDPGFGWEYHIPYRFDVSLDAEKANVDLHTLTLDNKVTKMTFNKQIPSATTSVAGLMSASDKTSLDNKADKPPLCPEWLNPTGETPYPWFMASLDVESTGKGPDADGNLNVGVGAYNFNMKQYYKWDKSLPFAATTTKAGLMTAADKTKLNNAITEHQDISGKQDKLTAGKNITIENNVISANDTSDTEYIELTGWDETSGWHDGGTLTDAQASILVKNELNYIWMNGMHRLDFRYKDDAYNLATYSANDGTKCHVIEIKLSDKTWRYTHTQLQEKLTAGTNVQISGTTISATDTVYDDTEIRGLINAKQDKLTAGDNITIENNVISATGGSAPDAYLSDASVDADNNLKIQNKNGQDIVNCTVNYTLTNDKVKAVLTESEKETLLSGVTGTTWVAANTAINSHTTALGNLKFVALTQAEYDALATKDENTLYIIKSA